MTWSLVDLPGYLDAAAMAAEIQAAFETWSDASGLKFEQVAEGGSVTISFEGADEGDHIFDGPGGALAKTSLAADALAVKFDEVVLQMMDFALEIMNFALRMMDLGAI